MQKQYTNPAIQQAFHRLETLSADERVRRLADMRERALINERSSLKAEREEGWKKGREEGELIGKIRTLQHVLHRQESSREELMAKSLEALHALAEDLERDLRQGQ